MDDKEGRPAKSQYCCNSHQHKPAIIKKQIRLSMISSQMLWSTIPAVSSIICNQPGARNQTNNSSIKIIAGCH
ncbi:hypothetical protein [Pedobacter hartonius]|uniref:Uncharacterized protein n=1 Tax=Pedobacter hartonius TaxID=425514 RepID=A0A1H4BVK2_9SPHI|nr:hypothetical protein [Pedobacter hartonius]SEA51862.1 hypothetical protein SAMN05443550_103475 [Pedobacter hartonius]